MKDLCNFCIEILELWEKETGISYEAINVWLFIIIQPILIIFGCVATIICANTKNEKVKRYLKWACYIILAIGIILTFLLFAIPILGNMISLKGH